MRMRGMDTCTARTITEVGYAMRWVDDQLLLLEQYCAKADLERVHHGHSGELVRCQRPRWTNEVIGQSAPITLGSTPSRGLVPQ